MREELRKQSKWLQNHYSTVTNMMNGVLWKLKILQIVVDLVMGDAETFVSGGGGKAKKGPPSRKKAPHGEKRSPSGE